jgi:transcriptional regulator GlxA family with amidase domain
MMEGLDQRTLGVLLFPRFELLDVCGPLQAFGMLKNLFDIVLVGETAGPVESSQGPSLVAEHGFEKHPPLDVLLVPGGVGVREQAPRDEVIHWIADRAGSASLVLSVGTGSVLLALSGVLDGRRATSNKRGLTWARQQGPRVQWVEVARWVDDDKFVTASGVSAGLDMALYVVQRIAGPVVAANVARAMEYEWADDGKRDPFA